MTDDDVMHHYRAYLLSLGLSDSTIRNYQAAVRRSRKWAESQGVDLVHLDAMAIAQLAASFPRTPSTLRVVRCALTHYFEMHDRWDAPIRAIRVPKKPKPQWRGVPRSDARSLIKTSIGWHPEGTAVLLGLYQAMRRSEIAAVRYDHFDPAFQWIAVLGKGAKTRRLYVHPIVRAQVRRFQGGYVWMFPGQGRRPHINPATVWAYVMRVADAAGVEYLTPHMLRHTAAETVASATTNIKIPRDFLGHERTETTEGYLDAKVRWEHMVAAAEALDAYLADE